MRNKEHQSQIDNFQKRHYGCRFARDVSIPIEIVPRKNICDLIRYIKTLDSDWYDKYLNWKGRGRC